jgi:serine/threonine-protein kinase
LTDCLGDETLLAFAEGRLAEGRHDVERHLDRCEECRALAAALVLDAPAPDPTAAGTAADGVGPLPGQLGERYELERRIGKGPHGEVFAARDRSRDERVAVKRIDDELAWRPGAVELVRDAVRRMRAIDHASVLRVHACHVEQGALVLVEELGEGEPIDRYFEARADVAQLAGDVGAQLVGALAAMHRSGIVHGRLVAENVLVDLSGAVLVTDVGLGLALCGVAPIATAEAKRRDVIQAARLMLRVLGEGEHTILFRRALEDPAAFPSGVELEAEWAEPHPDPARGPLHRWGPAPNEIIAGKYRVEGHLGSGGMGVVVTAIQLDLGRRVAIKMVPPRSVRRRAAVERFLREARALSAIDSEHVVSVYDVGRSDDGTPFMVMEYLEGTTLSRLVAAHGALPVEEALSYVMQACVAVAECHARGIVHRDLKPDNIMVLERPSQRGTVKVLDFGISKTEWVDDDQGRARLTGTMDVLGTPAYMSPEQVRSSKSVDARSDIWALGAVLYELLTGQPAFGGATVAALSAQIVSEDPPPPRLLRPDLPPELEQIVLGCLRKKPDERPQTVKDLADALAPFAGLQASVWRERIAAIDRESIPPASSPRASSCPPPPAGPSGRHVIAPPSQTSAAGEIDRDEEQFRAYLRRRARRKKLGLALAVGLTAGLGAALAWFVPGDDTAPDRARVLRTGLLPAAFFGDAPDEGARGDDGQPRADAPAHRTRRARVWRGPLDDRR